MISRYTRPEILAAEGCAKLGKVPKAAIARIRRKARFDVKRIREIEAEVKHEMIAFLSSVAESIGDDARDSLEGGTWWRGRFARRREQRARSERGHQGRQ